MISLPSSLSGLTRKARATQLASIVITSGTSIALSATSTFLIAVLCGPAVRGKITTAMIWLLFAQYLGLQGTSTLVSRALAGGAAPNVIESALQERRRIYTVVPGVTFAIFTIFVLLRRFSWIEGLLFAAAATSFARVNWNIELLQGGTNLRLFARYRLLATSAPQVAQLAVVLAGFRSVASIALSFLVGLEVGHRFGSARVEIPTANHLLRTQSAWLGIMKDKQRLTLTTNALLSGVAPRIDLLLLSTFATPVVVGQYSVAASIPVLTASVVFAVAVRSFRSGAASKRWRKTDSLLLVGIACASLIVMVIAKFGLPLLGSKYGPAVVPALWLAAGSAPAGCAWVISERWRGAGIAGRSVLLQVVTLSLTTAFILLGRSSENIVWVAKSTFFSQLISLVLAATILVFDSRKRQENAVNTTRIDEDFKSS